MIRRTAVDAVSHALARVDEVDRPEVWISLRDRGDLGAEAERIDARVAAGESLPLAGLTVAVKDNIDVAGVATTAASASFAYDPDSDATAVARLRAAGAIVVGKTNLDQFATGLVGSRSPFGAVRNAWDPSRISGGSSSGSAVAVALGLVDLALGTDTAGSGRVPAALNGIYGVKPTKGIVPTTGVVPACRTQDVVTVFARDLALARRAVELMSGPDGLDPLARTDAAHAALPAGSTIAVPLPEQLDGLAAGWGEAFAAAVARAERAGFTVVERDIAPLLEAARLLYDGAFVAERYSAVGAHIEANRALIGRDLDATVAGIILAGAEPTAHELFDDLAHLAELRLRGAAELDGCVALLTPTTTWHPTLAEVAADPVGANSRMGRYTNFANLLDFAALAIPAGFVDGLPFGVMLSGPAFSDNVLGQIAQRMAEASRRIFVVGAHLAGQPLNRELVAAGASFVAAARTAPEYGLFALATTPPKPGLAHTGGGGASIAGEVWELPATGFAAFVDAVPAPLAIGSVLLADGTRVAGFLATPGALAGALDISELGGWRAHLALG
ncbi:allophanate hydrolase [Microbacterium rhizosphaerae]|uniref:Allophanate hydrolase n=1 Tax=Microbacterium rhizosphaerae TaxID=1678237 RepID=A0ABZ0SL23_9MICO|nr:allophanate hydrolase [Microbacterium rhizosphaerae]WPR88879.1 allophanate hydrolase [Microbacterium rhizosphaerae]